MNCSVKPCEFSEVDGDFRSLIRGRTRSQAPAAWSSDAPFIAHAAAVAAAGGGGEGGSGEGGGGEGGIATAPDGDICGKVQVVAVVRLLGHDGSEWICRYANCFRGSPR